MSEQPLDWDNVSLHGAGDNVHLGEEGVESSTNNGPQACNRANCYRARLFCSAVSIILGNSRA